MKKTILATCFVLSAITSIGCSKASDPVEYGYFNLTNSTCDAPQTNLLVKGTQLFTDAYPTVIEISQNFSPFRVCKYKASGMIYMTAGVATVQQLAATPEGSCSGVDFEWEESYALSLSGKTLTLTSASCVNTFEKQDY